jgi:hypothetical protein
LGKYQLVRNYQRLRSLPPTTTRMRAMRVEVAAVGGVPRGSLQMHVLLLWTARLHDGDVLQTHRTEKSRLCHIFSFHMLMTLSYPMNFHPSTDRSGCRRNGANDESFHVEVPLPGVEAEVERWTVAP